MYKVRFYRDRNGEQPTRAYLEALLKRKDKDSRIRARKIQEYINILREHARL